MEGRRDAYGRLLARKAEVKKQLDESLSNIKEDARNLFSQKSKKEAKSNRKEKKESLKDFFLRSAALCDGVFSGVKIASSLRDRFKKKRKAEKA